VGPAAAAGAHGVSLLQGRRREIRQQAALEHRPPRNTAEQVPSFPVPDVFMREWYL
jgi:hypothetical protein